MPNALRLPQLAIGPELPRTLRETYAETLRAAEITYRGAKADRQAWPMLVRSFLALGLLSGCVTTNTLGDPCAAGDLSSGKGQEGSCGRDRDPALWSARLHSQGRRKISRSRSSAFPGAGAFPDTVALKAAASPAFRSSMSAAS